MAATAWCASPSRCCTVSINVVTSGAEMRSAGYRRSAEFDFLPVQSFQIFVPEERHAGADPGVEGEEGIDFPGEALID